jgi:PAS domain S-box-containing protein
MGFWPYPSGSMHTNNDPHFRNLVDNALTGIMDNTLEGKILFVNQALARMLEFESPEQMQADGTLLRWCDPERRKAFISRLKQQGYVNNYEVDVFSKTGKRMHVLLSARLQGDVISSMVFDITERKKTETALRESNQRFRATFEQAAIGLTFMAPDRRFLRVNQKFCDITGYSRDELLQRTCQEITCPDDLEADSSCTDRLLTGDTRSYSIEKRFVRKSGELVWAEVTFSLILDEAGEPLWFVSVVKDISQRKQVKDALLESEDKFRMLVTNTEEIVYMIAKDGTFVLSEGKGLAKLGLKPGQVVGKSVFELYKDHPGMLDEMRRAFNGETVTSELNVDGNYFRSWYTPHKNHDGQITGLLGLSVNITEQKLAEVKLQEYQQRLRALASELTLTEERERRNIALELHDQVGQSLAVMRMQLAVAQKESSGRKVAAILDEVSGSLRAAVHDTRNIISDLSSPVINELGLAAALSEWLKERIGEYYGLEDRCRRRWCRFGRRHAPWK